MEAEVLFDVLTGTNGENFAKGTIANVRVINFSLGMMNNSEIFRLLLKVVI